MPHSEDMAWVAGIFEGEGCVLVTKGLTLSVTVTNTDVRLLGRLKELCGGDICSGGTTKIHTHVKRWRIAHKSAYGFLRGIQPYLVGNKRDEVELALQFEPLMIRRGGRGEKVKKEISTKRMGIRLGLQVLKKRGTAIAT